MLSTTTYAIFWLPAGTQYEPAGNDNAYEGLQQQFLADVGGTSFYGIATQYPDGSNTYPANRSTFGGSYVDTTPYPQAGVLSDSDIQAAITRDMAAQGWQASPSTLVVVYTASGVTGCSDSSAAQCAGTSYCAAHSWFVPSGGLQAIAYATMPDPGNANGACLAKTPSGTYPNNDAAADSAVSLTSRELLASVTDPEGDGWTDSTGAELSDKCDWDFGAAGADGGNVTLHGHRYLVQREWSNAASACVLGYTSRSHRRTGSGGAIPIGNRTNRGTPATAATGALTATPTPLNNQANRRTPTPVVVGPPTATPTAVPGEANRETPTPAGAATPTPLTTSTPTPVAGRNHRGPTMQGVRDPLG